MATKRKNNTKTKTKSNSSNGKKTTSANRKTSTKAKVSSYVEDDDPFFEDSKKEIVLWVSIALCILLLISNIGLGGNVGNTVASFLFGVFGLIQYILPFFIAFSAFFLISNYGNMVAIAKVIAATILCLALSVFLELILDGDNLLGAVNTFYYSQETHNGGGFIGGGIALFLFENFGIFGAYLIDIIIGILCVIIIVEHFAFSKVQSSSQYHSDKAAAKRRMRREREYLEREANKTRFNDERQAIRNKLEEEYAQQKIESENVDGPRSNRKRTGVTLNTAMTPSYSQDLPVSNDGVNEIRFNGFDQNSEFEVTETKRHKLKADTKGKSIHNFKEDNNASVINDNKALNTPANTYVQNNEQIKINTPSQNFTEVKENPLPEPEVNETVQATRHARPSVTSENEMEAESKNMQATISKESMAPKKPYKFPPLNLLNEPKKGSGDSKQFLNEMASKLQHTLRNFGVEAEVKEVTLGPSVTQYKIQIDQGTKVSKVLNLSDDIKLNLAVTDVRIEAPIPGEPYIGIEVPNKEKTMVGFKELVSSAEFKNAKSKISFCVGKDIQGRVIVGNIEKMPHLLIAGATGSGKSVCINTIIMSIIYHANPDDVKLIMVDPKMVELSVYNGIPHLLIPVVTDPKKAAGALHWAVKEMTDRYELLAAAGVRNIESFNEKVERDALPDTIPAERRQHMPQIVIILDELADLMMVAAADVEDSIVRLAQLARAAGIHLIIATQRPTANVITGLIKGNVPSRIAFSVSSGIDSRVILDMNGAEDLLGNGDMLYAPQNLSKPVRIQGAFVSEEEVARVVDYLKKNNDQAAYSSDIEDAIQKSESQSGAVSITGEVDDSRDVLFAEAGRLVIENQKGSIGYLQRNFRIGFNRAARIMDQLAEAGVVGPELGTKPREIRMTIPEFEDLVSKM